MYERFDPDPDDTYKQLLDTVCISWLDVEFTEEDTIEFQAHSEHYFRARESLASYVAQLCAASVVQAMENRYWLQGEGDYDTSY